MNNFYNQHIVLQWALALLMLIVPLAFVILLLKLSGEHALLACLLALFAPSLVPFFGAPIARLAGYHQYMSPMLLLESANDHTYAIHNGTSFDYLITMRGIKPGAQFNKTMLAYYVAGLLEIISKIEARELPQDAKFQGSSYFFSQRTAERLGFTPQQNRLALKIHFLVNYIDLTWMYSLSKGRLAFPKIYNMKSVSIAGKDLVCNKERLTKLYAKLLNTPNRRPLP